MTHLKRKLTLLLMCLLLLGGAAMASSEEIETDASGEITEEAETESKVPQEETPTAEADPCARDYINYYLMPGDSPYLEVADATEYIYTADLIEEAGLAEVIYIPDTPALLADFGADSAVRYNYGWWGGGTIYYGTKTGTLGPIYLGSPFGDAAATYITADLHTDYFYSSYMGAYYDCYCLSARSSYPKDKWVASSGESKWNALSSSVELS